MLDLQRLFALLCQTLLALLYPLYPSFNSVLAIRAAFDTSDSAVCMSFEFVDKRRVGYEQFCTYLYWLLPCPTLRY
jgi:hypothetical protein